jgi:hypothetical protein
VSAASYDPSFGQVKIGYSGDSSTRHFTFWNATGGLQLAIGESAGSESEWESDESEGGDEQAPGTSAAPVRKGGRQPMTERSPSLIDPADFDPAAYTFKDICTELMEYVKALRAHHEMDDDEKEGEDDALDPDGEKIAALLGDPSEFAADLQDTVEQILLSNAYASTPHPCLPAAPPSTATAGTLSICLIQRFDRKSKLQRAVTQKKSCMHDGWRGEWVVGNPRHAHARSQ